MSAPAGTFELIARHLTLALRPLLDGLSDVDHFKQLMFRLGWKVTALPSEYAALFAATDTAVNKFEALTDNPTPSEVAELLQAVKSAYDAIQSITTAPPGVDAGAFLAEIGGRLFELLLTDYLAAELNGLYHFFRMTNVIQLERAPAVTGRPSFVRVRFEWSEIPKIVSHPEDLPAIVYGWGTSELRVQRIVDHLAELFFALGLPVQAQPADSSLAAAYAGGTDDLTSKAAQSLLLPFYFGTIANQQVQAGFQIRELPASAAELPGLVLEPLIPSQFPLSFPLSDTLNLRVLAGTNAGSLFGILIRPDGVSIRYPFSPGTEPPQAGIGVGMDFKPASAAILAGDKDSTRLELQGASLDLAASMVNDAFELVVDTQLTGLTLVLNTGEGDSFIQGVSGGGEKKIDLSLGVEWSSSYGVRFKGRSAFEVDFQPHLNLGPISIDDVTIRLAVPSSRPPDVVLEVGAAISGELGPVQFVVQGLGLRVAATFTSGNVGPFDIGLGFMPPTGVGLEIDAGAIAGGGFINFDPEKNQYAGTLDVSIVDTIQVKVIAVLDTILPDGSKGFSFLFIITFEFPPLQLSFGFTLNGVGGLGGVNRTMNIDGLRTGFRAHTIDSIMFPPDPVKNAPQIVSNIRNFFPPAQSRYLFGPMFEIGWGEPTLITFSIGLILEVQDPIRLVLLGLISGGLPTLDQPLIELHIDVLGTLDFATGILEIDGSLYDSRVLIYAVAGDLFFRASLIDQTGIFALGGFNPHFNTTGLNIPALKRMSVSIGDGDNPRISTNSYLAITSNTLQFGANVEAYASAGGFSVHGYLGFDVLIIRSPFSFEFDFSAGFDISFEGASLAGLKVNGTLTGYRPWHLHGEANIDFLFFSVSKSVDHTWGDSTPAILPAMPVQPDLLAALGAVSNWSAALPDGTAQAVTLSTPAPGSNTLRVHPMGTLSVRENVVPLDLTITRYGGATPSDGNFFSISKVQVNSQDEQSNAFTDYFASGQFFSLSDADKLSKPSFERYDAGVTIGSPAILNGADSPRTVNYEERYVPDPKGFSVFSRFYAMPATVHAALVRQGAGYLSAVKNTGLVKYANGLATAAVTTADATYVIASTADLAIRSDIAFGGGVTYFHAQVAMNAYVAAHPEEAANLQILPLHEVGL